MAGLDFNFLIVDDDDVDVELINRVLGKRDINGKIMRARDGVEALGVLCGESDFGAMPEPLVMLLDINMPRMNGHELLAQIRANDSLRETLIFMVTTSDNIDDKRKAYCQDVEGYLLKSKIEASLDDMFEFLKRQ